MPRTLSAPLVVFAMLLALLGTVVDWLSFPLSTGLPGRVAGPWGPVPAAFIAVAGLAAGALAHWRGRSRLAALVYCSLAVFLLALLPRIMFAESDWLSRYMRDSTARSGLQGYLAAIPEPNFNVEPTLEYLTSFEHLGERLQIALATLGAGWVLAALAVAVCFCALWASPRAPSRPTTLLALGLPLAVALALALPGIVAEVQHLAGDRELAAGNAAAALEKYAAALQRDAVLGESQPFLAKVARAHYRLYGDAHPFSRLHLAERDSLERKFEAAVMHLQLMRGGRLPASPFSKPMRAYADHLESRIQSGRGIAWGQRAMPGLASARYEDALRADAGFADTAYYRASTDLELRIDASARWRLDALTGRIAPRPLQADLSATTGDAWRQRRDWAAARELYRKSYELDELQNYRAYKALSGS